MKFYGLDITQHKEYCISAEQNQQQTFVLQQEERPDTLPSAILPEYRHEKVMLSSDAKTCRRGLGLLWPRNAQIPVGGDWANGVGRVPLLTCLSNIKAEGDADEWKFIDSKISWKPHPSEASLAFSNAEILGLLFHKLKDAKQSCFVIPEGFGESAQQTLSEAFPENTTLIPRSIALALKWCREHQTDYENVSIPIGNQESIGHLLCASLGFGEWEVSLIEITRVRKNEKIYLVPVYDPTITGQGLGFCGLSLCKSMLPDGQEKDSVVWKKLCNSSWFHQEYAVKTKPVARIQGILRNQLLASTPEIPYKGLAIMDGLNIQQKTKGNLKEKIALAIEKQRRQIGNFQKVIGIAAGGSFAPVQICPLTNESDISLPADHPYMTMPMNKLKRFVDLQIYQAERAYLYRLKQTAHAEKDSSIAQNLFSKIHADISIYSPQAFAEGASIAAYCIANSIPSYQIKLVPMQLYSIARNHAGDKVEKWEELVIAKTLEAGETYQQPQPIKGLSIPEGKEHLELILQRPGRDRQMIYRRVIAKIPQKTDRREPVLITTNVRPGQGFAKVNITSARKGVFTTILDWRTMEHTPKPELKLEYIADVAFIEPDWTMWQDAKYSLKKFVEEQQLWEKGLGIRSIEKTGGLSADTVKSARMVLNKWRHDPAASTIFRHIGPINSDGNENKLLDRGLLKSFCSALEKVWNKAGSKDQNAFLRIGGWLYLYIPASMQKIAERYIAANEAKAVHLHIAGLTFHKDSQFKLFFKAFCHQTAPSAEWFRTLKNIVRFRDNALSDEIVTDEQIQTILKLIVFNLSLSYSYSPRKYNSSIEAFTYLLKRRRYDEDFLEPENPLTLRLHSLFKGIMQNHVTGKYRNIARAALAFLDRKATSANLTAILEADDGDDDDE